MEIKTLPLLLSLVMCTPMPTSLNVNASLFLTLFKMTHLHLHIIWVHSIQLYIKSVSLFLFNKSILFFFFSFFSFSFLLSSLSSSLRVVFSLSRARVEQKRRVNEGKVSEYRGDRVNVKLLSEKPTPTTSQLLYLLINLNY